VHKGLADLKPNVGIIGNGMIGNRLAKKIAGLGWNVLINDPLQSDFNSKIGSETRYYSLDEIAQCNIISVHVPLTWSGSYATGNLLGKKFFRALPQNAIIINTSRGGVIDEGVLIDMTREREDLIMVIDVWNNEPYCNEALIELAAIATPHIAGYSGRAKANAVLQISRAFLEFFGLDVDSSCVFDSKIDAFVELTEVKNCADAMRKVFPIVDISSRFKKSVASGKNVDGNDSFDNLRRSLATRAECCEYAMPGFVSEDAVRFLSAAGFRN
jgi:erythronate-4-phosphate dehydrogenase